MNRKLSKAKPKVRRCPTPGTPAYDKWKRNISVGMRRAKRRRREKGLLTLAQLAALTCLPIGALRKMAVSGDLKSILAGTRRYVPESEVKRLMDAA